MLCRNTQQVVVRVTSRAVVIFVLYLYRIVQMYKNTCLQHLVLCHFRG
jgi:hypothetical protein